MMQTEVSVFHAQAVRVGAAILAGACAFAGGALSDDACLIIARRR